MTLFYQEYGDKKAPLMLFLHGGGVSGWMWREQVQKFEIECRDFLENAINSEQWFIWVAEEEGRFVSHIYIELIQKVPRPGRITRPFAFMTNMYTVSDYRNKGIGSHLLTAINEWANKEQYEFIIVWPSDDSINYYRKNGYSHCKEPMEYFPS